MMLLAHIRENFEKAFYPRMSEWSCATMVCLLGYMFYMKPDAMAKSPVLSRLLELATQPSWAQAFFMLGGVRLAVLLINGAWSKSPYLRALSALLCCFLWTQLVMAAAAEGSVGLAIYPVLLIGDLINLYRAMGDARVVDDSIRGQKNAGQRLP